MVWLAALVSMRGSFAERWFASTEWSWLVDTAPRAALLVQRASAAWLRASSLLVEPRAPLFIERHVFLQYCRFIAAGTNCTVGQVSARVSPLFADGAIQTQRGAPLERGVSTDWGERVYSRLSPLCGLPG